VLNRIRSTYHEYPSKFWVLVGAVFIDNIGRTILQPFFALYVTDRFNVGMTEAGALFAVFSVTGFAGNMLGGALTDRFGRKGMVLFGLVLSATTNLSMGLATQLSTFYILAATVGLLSDIAGPAHGAMVADLLPEEKRAEGFGMLRVVANLSWVIGPTIGGFLATQSFMLLFVADAAASLITAVIFARAMPETRPEAHAVGQRETMGATFAGYFRVLADRPYVVYLLTAALMNLVYLQMYSTLSVYLRDVHALPTREYGLMMSSNATLVVLTQFWVTRRTRKYRPLVMMALGTTLYMIGFTLYGFVSTYPLFIGAMLIITCGEMIAIPVSQALVARFAPEDMRGRYMAIAGIAWGIPHALGPWAAGLIMDNYNPNWIWYLCGILAAVAIAGYLLLDARLGSRFAATPAPAAEPAPAV
jgi:MFS family permease